MDAAADCGINYFYGLFVSFSMQTVTGDATHQRWLYELCFCVAATETTAHFCSFVYVIVIYFHFVLDDGVYGVDWNGPVFSSSLLTNAIYFTRVDISTIWRKIVIIILLSLPFSLPFKCEHLRWPVDCWNCCVTSFIRSILVALFQICQQ